MGLKRWKAIVVLASLCLFLLTGAIPAAAQGWPNGYGYRRAVTIDHTEVPNTDQANFPVLISGAYADLATTANGGKVTNANGYDILFTSDANGANPLPFEQESYNPSTGTIIYWVQLPTVSHTLDTTFFLFYGNSSISTDQSNKTSVWDSNYKGVWHLPNGSTLSGTDSTSNAYNLTNNSTSATTGQVDGAASFNGSNNYLSNSSLSITAGASITISFWNYVATANVQNAAAFTIGASDNPNRIQADAPWSDFTLYWDYGSWSGGGRVTQNYHNYVGQWTYIALEYNSSNSTHSIYLNGTLAASTVNSDAPQSTETGIDIGAWPTVAYEHGNIDEFRVSTIARSPDWIAAEYNNQSSPSTFAIVGSPGQGPTSLTITRIVPTVAHWGDSVSIEGTNFGASQGNSTVSLNGTSLLPQAWTDTGISVTVPVGAPSGTFSVVVNGQTAVSPPFTVIQWPAVWSHGDIGSVGLAGSASYANGVFTLKVAGTGIGSTADGMHFAYQSLTGDGTIVARVINIQNGYYPVAGVMIRNTLDPGAADAFAYFIPNQGYMNYRTSAGASASTQSVSSIASAYPYWVKLVRSGNAFTGYVSQDGADWTQIGGSQTISMSQTVYIGLAACGCSTSGLATVTFDNVSISSTADPAPVITSLSATTGSVGSQVVISGSGFGAYEESSLVSLNYARVTIDSWSDTSIIVTIPTGATSGLLLVSVAPSMNDSNPVYFEVTTQPLPLSILNQDIGAVGNPGSATFANGVYTVTGYGNGAINTPDQFHFVYQPLSGDGTIVARVVSVQGGTSPEAGVMIRETLSSSATDAFPADYESYILFIRRTSTGGSISSAYDASGVTLPYWIKLARSGNTFTGYSSTDGVNWVRLETGFTITMAQNVYVGLAVSSGSNTSSTTVTFDNVSISSASNPAPVITNVSATTGTIGSQIVITGSGFGGSQGNSQVLLSDAPVTINSWSASSITITIPSGAISGCLGVMVAPSMNASNAINFTVTTQPLPSPWLDQDVGSVGVAGSSGYTSGTFTVKGAGSGMSGTADQFHFVYQSLSGDGMIVARVANVQGALALAGVMIRETLGAGATSVFARYYEAYILTDERTTTGGSVSSQYAAYNVLPYWIRLVRSGNTFTGYGSADGVNWVQLGTSQSVSMATNVYVGLAVASGHSSSLATAAFDNVSIVAGAVPTVSGITPNLGGFGTPVTITGNNFGSSQGSSSVTFNGLATTAISSWSNAQIVASVPSGATTGPVAVTVNSVSSTPTFTFTAVNPVITSLTPAAASPGGTIVVAGSGFGPTQNDAGGEAEVYFNGVQASVTAWSDTSVTVIMPSNATSGPVTLTEDGATSNGVQFTVLEALTVTAISPTSAPVGGTVTITGTGFGPSQSNSLVVFFPGITATVSSWSDTQIVATIPVAYSGPVGVGVATEYVFGPTFHPTSTANLTDSLGNQTTYTSEQIAGRWLPLNVQGAGCSSCTLRGTISYTYDANGNALSRTDENGNNTTYTYDSNGNVLTVTVPINSSISATTTYTYNSGNEVLTATDPLGNVTTNTYDAKGNVLTVTTPAPNGNTAASVTQFAYNSLGELTQITDPLNNVTKLTYFATGLINTITDAQSNVTTYGYDAHGNRTSVIDALNHQTTFTYDSMDRLTKITYPDTTTTQFGYDYRGRRTSVTDQNGKVTSYVYDDADRLLTVTDAATNVTTYGYDTENNLTSIKDANLNTTSFTYDAFGRVTKTTFPSNLTETYGYDAVGNLTSKTDRKGQYIAYTYDQLNRLTLKTYPDTTTVNYTYDNDSRLTQVVDPTGTYSFTFDNMGRLTNATSQYSFLTSRSFTTAYSYDAASNQTGFTDAESGSTTYAYDTLNRLQTLTPPSAISSGNFGFGYDALSRRTSLTRPNSITTNYSYDNLSRLLSVLHQSGTTTLDGAVYTVDNAGNRTSKADQHAGVTSNYTYDPIYELTQVTQATNTTESYTFDPVGNRLSSLGVSSYTNNSSNELTSNSNATYTYDYNGNILTKVVGSNTTAFAWDYENRLTSVTLPGSGGTVSFKYDPFGRRIYKSSSSATSIYAYDGDNLIEETNSSGTSVARYSQGLNIDEPLAMLRSSTTSYYQADGLGSITSLSNTSGSIVATYTYDSFGNLTASTGSLTNPFQYTARELDPETSLYYYRARYYDPHSGRFIREDPSQFEGGPNFYAYVHSNATNLSDPSGLKFEVAGDWKSFWDAIRYLTRDPGMAQIIKKLSDDDTVYTINTNSHGIDNTDLFGHINWDPHMGLECDGQEGAAISPALALGHELGHLTHPWYKRIGYPTFDAYDDSEERTTIQQIENPAARSLGEGIRRDHQGKHVRVKSDRTVPSCDCARPEQSGIPKKPL